MAPQPRVSQSSLLLLLAVVATFSLLVRSWFSHSIETTLISGREHDCIPLPSTKYVAAPLEGPRTGRTGRLCGSSVRTDESTARLPILWPPAVWPPPKGTAPPPYRLFSNAIAPSDLRVLSMYTSQITHLHTFWPRVHVLRNVTICSEMGPADSIASLVVDEDGKLIDLSSKYFSFFLVDGYHPVDVDAQIRSCLARARSEAPSAHITVPVFYAFDNFIGMPSHHYEDLLHALAVRDLNCLHDVSALLPSYNNTFYRKATELVQRHAGANVQFFEPGTVFHVDTLFMTQPYHGFLWTTRAFVDEQLIPSCLAAYAGRPTHDKIAIIKLASQGAVQHSAGRAHTAGPAFFAALERHNITLINSAALEQDEVIYYLNTARYLLTTWGATSAISAFFTSYSAAHVQVVIVAHPGYAGEYALMPPDNSSAGLRTRYSKHGLGSRPGRADKYILDVSDLDTMTEDDFAFDSQRSFAAYAAGL